MSDTISVKTTCPWCNTENPPVVMTNEQYEQYQSRSVPMIQLTNGDRDKAEYLITGICIPCWAKFEEAFPSDDSSNEGYPEYEDGEEDPMDAEYGHNIDGRISPQQQALMERGDYIGPEEAAAILDDDEDPICVCGVYRSEHQMCGCPEGFQSPSSWESEKAFIGTLDDDQFERIYG